MSDMSPNRNSMISDKKQDAPVRFLLIIFFKLIFINFFIFCPQFSGLRKILLTIYIVIIVLFTAALVVIVVLAPIEDTITSLKTKMMN